MPTLNTLPVRVPIGTADQSGSVLMTPEFARLLSGLLERIGGVDGAGTDDLQKMIIDLGKQVNLIGISVNEVVADVALAQQDAIETRGELSDLEIDRATDASLGAQVAVLSRRIHDLQIQMAFLDQPRR